MKYNGKEYIVCEIIETPIFIVFISNRKIEMGDHYTDKKTIGTRARIEDEMYVTYSKVEGIYIKTVNNIYEYLEDNIKMKTIHLYYDLCLKYKAITVLLESKNDTIVLNRGYVTGFFLV